MSFVLLGFITGLSLILALGSQNIFVIEQGLKKEFIFIVCLICSLSDLLLIFSGIFLFHHFQFIFTPLIEFILNFLLLFFLLNFIFNKINAETYKLNLNIKNERNTLSTTLLKTFAFTYLNPHVYSDTVFFRKLFKRSFVSQFFFGLVASASSFMVFFLLGYMSKYLSNYLKTKKVWKIINLSIIIFMSVLVAYVSINIIKFLDFYL